MSRRVFDVGLDMSRMRHSLNPHRRTKSTKSSRPGTSDGTKSSDAANQMAIVPQRSRRKSSPTPPLRDRLDEEASDTANAANAANNADDPQTTQSPPTNRLQWDFFHSSKRSPLGSNPITASEQVKPKLNGSSGEGKKVTRQRSTIGDQNYDLKPPPPNSKVKHIDSLCQKLLSGEHLNIILKDPSFFLRFTAFLNRYKPQSSFLLMKYLEVQKTYKAIEYANAVAESLIETRATDHSPTRPVASIDSAFEDMANRLFDNLVSEALPAYITNCLSKVVTEYMVRDITGTGVPATKELVSGLAEVFCLADPQQEDCPIVYASEEFYRTSRYSRDDVIGRNCRFLQGTKTDQATIARIRTRVRAGQEVHETILNYRRDGSPFVNLLLTAPLFDNRGNVKYFIGAQVDVSGLVEDGRGLESFARLLNNPKRTLNRADSSSPKHLQALNDLSQMLSSDESAVLSSNHSTSPQNPSSHISNAFNNIDEEPYSLHSRNASSTSTPPRRSHSTKPRQRVVLGSDSPAAENSSPLNSHNPGGQGGGDLGWTLSSSLPSGKMPGVYQNYLLVRPTSSLRIIFVSPSLRIPGLLQSPLLSHIAGPAHVRKGLEDALLDGVAVTAKVNWRVAANPTINDTAADDGADVNGSAATTAEEGKERYLSCTPLLGSDDEVGVWMVIMVENESVTGGLSQRQRYPANTGTGLRNGINSNNSGSRKSGTKNGQNAGTMNGDWDEDARHEDDDAAEYNSFIRQNAMGDSQRRSEERRADVGVGEKREELINGFGDLAGERRVEEVFTPSDEKVRMM